MIAMTEKEYNIGLIIFYALGLSWVVVKLWVLATNNQCMKAKNKNKNGNDYGHSQDQEANEMYATHSCVLEKLNPQEDQQSPTLSWEPDEVSELREIIVRLISANSLTSAGAYTQDQRIDVKVQALTFMWPETEWREEVANLATTESYDEYVLRKYEEAVRELNLPTPIYPRQ